MLNGDVSSLDSYLTTSDLLKSALFRGGLTNETLDTLLAGESNATTASEVQQYDYAAGDNYTESRHVPLSNPTPLHHPEQRSVTTNNTETSCGYGRPRAVQLGSSNNLRRDTIDDFSTDDQGQTFTQRVPLHDQRTVLISNLPERATHKELTEIIRGGRLLDIFLRNDRTATVSFVEGAGDFLAYAKRADVYLHMKRVS